MALVVLPRVRPWRLASRQQRRPWSGCARHRSGGSLRCGVVPKRRGSAATAIWRRMAAMVDEVAELTVRDLGEDRAVRAAQ